MLLISTASLENKEKYVFECAVGMKNEILCFDVETSCKITRILSLEHRSEYNFEKYIV